MFFNLRDKLLDNIILLLLAMSKKLLVLGASGQTGQELLKQALERNHHVTALVGILFAAFCFTNSDFGFLLHWPC